MSQLDLTENAADVGVPTAGKLSVYAKAGAMFTRDDAGVVVGPFVASGAGVPVADTTALVKGSGDPTKLVRIEADGLSPATTRVITMPDKDVTLDDAGDSRPAAAHASAHQPGGSDETGVVSDAANNTVVEASQSAHRSSINTIPGFGVKHTLKGDDSASFERDMAEFLSEWISSTGGTEASRLKLRRKVLGVMQDALSVEGFGIKIHDGADPTKKFGLDLTAVTTATERKLILPDQDIDLDPVTGTFSPGTIGNTTPTFDAIPQALAGPGLPFLSEDWMNGLKAFELIEQPVAATNSTTAFVNYVTLNFTNAGGASARYVFVVFFVWGHDDTGTRFQARVRHNGVTQQIDPGGLGQLDQQPTSTANRHTNCVIGSEIATAGANTLELDFRSSSAGKTAEVFHAFLCVFKQG